MRPCLVLTRPQADSARFAENARAFGWDGDILIAPLLEIVLHPVDESAAAQARTLVFTSQHAVSALCRATSRRDWTIWAVGPRSAEAARAAGFRDVRQSGGDAAALLADLVRDPPPAPVLHLHGQHAAVDLAARLQASGQKAQGLVVYDQVAKVLDDRVRDVLRQQRDVVLPVFSPRSARLLAMALHDPAPMIDTRQARLHLLAISAAAAEAARALRPDSCILAGHPDADAMLSALADLQATLEP